ncbi:hypothetical protein [Dactylococcopsis salina]|uniref:hypothetical protein n=1 Tax=Dactylococcopsis salina TaxID=292566 RepID=UPI0012E9E8D7|nr:hypothetical protein [Dactylococcopsis salina]
MIPNQKQQLKGSGSILLSSSSQDGCTTEVNWNDYNLLIPDHWSRFMGEVDETQHRPI